MQSRYARIDPSKFYLALRITWINWLCTLFLLAVKPAVLLTSIGGGSLEAIAAHEWISASDFSWNDLFDSDCVWWPLLLAAIVPTMVHVYRRNRSSDPFERRPRAPGTHETATYRAPLTYSLSVNSRVFATYMHWFAVRLVVAIVLSGMAYWRLFQSRPWKNFGCVAYSYTHSIPEYTAYWVIFLIVVLVHVPTPRQVFGASASDFYLWQKSGRSDYVGTARTISATTIS